jgi:tetratricopeptide (TPR) repeat protein
VLPQSRFGSTRWCQRGGTAVALVPRALLTLALAAPLLSNVSGCAILSRHRQSPEAVAAAREMSRQGVASLEMGQTQQAEDLLRQALAQSPEDASSHRYMAEALWRRGAGQEALAHMDEAVKLEPGNAALAVRAGEMSLASGGRDLALAHAERAIRLEPKLETAWALRGRCFRQMNQPDRALADLQRAVELAPDRSDLLLEVADIYRQRGQNTRCLTALYHLLDTYPPGNEPQSVLVMQGLTLMDLRRPQQATEAFLAAKEHGPPSADLFFYLAQSYSASGQTSEATAAAQQALAVNASHEPSRQLLAQLAARTAPSDAPQRR